MRYQVLAVAAAALLAFSSSASAQGATAVKLETGAWTGQVTPPDGQTVTVIYDVAYAGDTLKIAIRAGDHGTFSTSDVKLDADKLSFRFRPGIEVVCVLDKKDTSYAGVCTGEDGSTATMDLSPPKKEPTKS